MLTAPTANFNKLEQRLISSLRRQVALIDRVTHFKSTRLMDLTVMVDFRAERIKSNAGATHRRMKD
jgi:hypothetical protein